MLINEITLTETYENLLPGDDKKKMHYAKIIFDMLTTAYADMGGIKGKGFESPEDMLNIPMWKIFRRGSNIQTVVLYKDTGGRKMVAAATDGSKDGRNQLVTILKDDFLRGRAFSEMSDKMLTFFTRKVGQDVLNSISVPVEQVQQYFEKRGREIRPVSDFEYQRELKAGEWHTKLMVGTLGNTIT